jgi:asparagine synthase (glutamine-hydrolysing)
MSGFVGIVNLDGAPVDGPLLDGLTASLTFRGPDGRGTRVEEGVGLGHSLLRSDPAVPSEEQPLALDGRLWIVADARLDNRSRLTAGLGAGSGPDGVSDAGLILRAYRRWRESCVDHLLGDFSFALWDRAERRLFCARDHLGVKPFYYALSGESFLFSNTLDCLRLHPALSGGLNEQAVADFLLFGCNMDLETTTFEDVRRLPPAGCCTWSAEGMRSRRYWALPVGGRIRYRKGEEYVAHFQELLRTSVADRLPSGPAAIWMSGGVDSTSIAAAAARLRGAPAGAGTVKAFTVVYDSLLPDDERRFAARAAEALGLPVQFLTADGYRLFEGWESPGLRTPEPLDNPLSAIDAALVGATASYSPVVLYGQGGDEVLAQATLRESVRTMGLLPAVASVAAGLLAGEHPPPPGTGLLARLRRLTGQAAAPAAFPPWIDRGLAARCGLETRFSELNRSPPAPPGAPRPGAWSALTTPFWQSFFESCDAGWTLRPLDVRHPFLDLRLVDYLLSIPPLPWFVDKAVLRRSLRGILPEEVRRRRKTPLGYPTFERLRRGGCGWVDSFKPVPELPRYVNLKALPRLSGWGGNPGEADAVLRPLGLNYWLKKMRPRSTIGRVTII